MKENLLINCLFQHYMNVVISDSSVSLEIMSSERDLSDFEEWRISNKNSWSDSEILCGNGDETEELQSSGGTANDLCDHNNLVQNEQDNSSFHKSDKPLTGMFSSRIAEHEEKSKESLCSSISEQCLKQCSYRNWKPVGFGFHLWNDEQKPFVKVWSYDDIFLDDDELWGQLSDKIIACSQSYLDYCPESENFVLAKLVLHAKGLDDISVLQAHPYLQYIDLSWNYLQDISALGEVPFLMYLDVSHNKLETLLNFKAPHNLTYVNYSYNNIHVIRDISEFWSVTDLNLSHNLIKKIDGLQQLRYLQNLDLSCNFISHFENLSHMHIINLDLRNNNITTFETGCDVGIKTLLHLYQINLSKNKLSSLGLFEGAYHLHKLYISENAITDLTEISNLQKFFLLQVLDIRDNKVTELPGYQELVLHTVPSVKYLDGCKVTYFEKVAARNCFCPDEVLAAAQSHAELTLLEQLKRSPCKLLDDVVPVDERPFPLVVLVGPPGSKKSHLVHHIADTVSDKVKVGVSHTTRPKEPNEIDGKYYHFVSQKEFDDLVKCGAFISVTETLGSSYGFGFQELANCVDSNKLCLTHTDLSAALTLSGCSVKPIFVLALPASADVHLERLLNKYEASVPEGQTGLLRIKKRTVHGTNSKKSAVSDSAPGTTKKGTSVCMCGQETCMCNMVYTTYDHNTSYNTSETKYLEEIYIRSSLKTRQEYLDMHCQNPGFFSKVIFTDDLNNAYLELKKFLRSMYRARLQQKPLHSLHEDHYYREAVHEKLNYYNNIINNHNLVNVKQLQPL